MTSNAATLHEPNDIAYRMLSGPHFADLYRRTMEFVERAANYMDGPGRRECGLLSATDRACYMLLTNHVTNVAMKAAAVGLGLRSVKVGERGLESVLRELESKDLIGEVPTPDVPEARLPKGILDLASDVVVLRLDYLRFMERMTAAPEDKPNQVHAVMGMLSQAFGRPA